jgi:cytochrome P450
VSLTTELARRAKSVAISLTEAAPYAARPLAQPPAGSELAPVLGDPGLPLVGHTLAMMGDTLEFCRERYAKHGAVSWIGGLGSRFVLVMGPDAIGEILTNRDKAYSNAEGWGYVIGPFFDRGLMLMDFEEHHQHRRIMQQAFTRDRLISYLDAMNPQIAKSLHAWQPGADFPFYDELKKLTLDLAASVFVGVELGPEADRLNEAFVDTVRAGQSVVRAPVPGLAWWRGLRGREVLVDYFRSLLPAKRAGSGEDMLSSLCQARDEDGSAFSDEDIVNHMIFLLMAAHDTSTITLSMMVYFLGKYPQWQDRVRAESLALGTEFLGFDDIEQLPAMELVMKESLRMFAPVVFLVRQALRDTSLSGRYIPGGTKFVVAMYPSHRMQPWWNDPDTFDPERFTPERAEDKSHRYAWAPFGAGVHKCIGLHFGGMEVKAILHQLVQRYSWSVPSDYEVPVAIGTGPLPADGLPITLRRLAT